MALVIQEPPALPVPLAEVKAYLRIAHGDEDALLAGLVRAAAQMCESFTGRALIARGVEETLRAASAWTRLDAAPVLAISGVASLDGEGGAEALAPADYAIDIDAAGEGWVRLLNGAAGGKVRVSYSAGMAADPNGIPEAIRHGIVRLAAYFYSNRDGSAAPPAAVTALWRPWRRMRLR